MDVNVSVIPMDAMMGRSLIEQTRLPRPMRAS